MFIFKNTSLLFIELIIFNLAFAPNLYGKDYAKKEKNALRTAIILGGVGGLVASYGYRDINSLKALIPLSLIDISTFSIANYYFTKTLIDRKISFPRSILYGAGAGLVAGAIVGILTFTPHMTVGWAMNTVSTGRLDAWYEIVGMSMLAGAFWGGLSGLAIGVFEAPIFSIVLKF